jgi:hypothetical protein
MSALSTVYWTFSIIYTFHLINLDSSSVRACIGSDNAPACLANMLVSDNSPVNIWKQMLQGILFANVSTVQGTSLVSTPIIRKGIVN